MKNQLRKATLRAAALTMSATIAATSVPMTAFAEEGNDGQKDDGSQQVSTAKSAEAQVADKEKTTSGVVGTADAKVGAIDLSEAENAGIDTSKMAEEVTSAKTNAGNAVKNEAEVTKDVKAIVDSKEAEDGINASEYAIEELISKKKEIVETENKNQEEINKEIAAAEEAIKNKANKEEADSIVKGANEKITSGNESYTKAANGIAELDKVYNKEMSNLETKQTEYSDAVSKGVKDIEKVEGDIANAKTNVTDLQNQVTNLTTEVNNMSTEVKKTAVEELADKYNDARRTPEGTKELFETIVKSYQEDILGKGATVEEIGSYNDEYKAYPVTYKIGDNEVTVYLSYTTNDDDNGITINEVTKREVVDKEGYDAYYKHGNTVFSESEYEELVEDGVVVEKTEKNGKKTSYYLGELNLTEKYVNGTTTDKDGNEVTTTVTNKRTVISKNGAVQVIGDVKTITKTTESLDTTERTTYKTLEEANEGIAAKKAEYERLGYENVEVTVEQGTKWAATAIGVTKQTEPTSSEEKGLYGDEWFLLIKVKECDKLALSSDKVGRKTWNTTYINVEYKDVDYSIIDELTDAFEKDKKKKEIIQEEVDKIQASGGYVFEDLKTFNWNIFTARLFYAKGTPIVTVEGYDTEKEAIAAVEEAVKGYNTLGTKVYSPASKYEFSYKITGTKTTETEENSEDVELASSGNKKASKLSYHEGQETTYKNVFDSEKAYDNSFLDTAKNDKTKRLEEEEKLSNEKTAKQKTLGELNTQLTEASKALEKAKTDSAELKKQVDALNTTASTIGANIKLLKENYTNLKLDSNGTEGRKQKIEDAYNKLPNRPSNNGGNNNGGGSSNNNNNNNNQPAAPVLPVGPVATTTTTQQVVTLVDDQTPLSATADDTVAPKTNKKAAKKNAAKTTDSDSKKTNKNNTKKQPKKVTPEVEDDTMDEDLEIVSLDDNDQVPLAPGVADTKTDDIIDETSSVSWLWLIILVCASVVTFGTYKGVKKHNENKGKNNR